MAKAAAVGAAADVAAVIIRQDPPMNIEYITSLLVLELLAKHILILQKFFLQIKDGDKRIFIINNKTEIALKRFPVHGQYKANLASIGTAMQKDITEQELKICLELCPYLQENGIFMAGVDVIDGKLIEGKVTLQLVLSR